MPDNDFTQEPEELPTLHTIVATIGSGGVTDDSLRVVTEDGRALRVVAIRYPGGTVTGAEIVVTEEDA